MSPGITKNAEESIENILFELEIFRGEDRSLLSAQVLKKLDSLEKIKSYVDVIGSEQMAKYLVDYALNPEKYGSDTMFFQFLENL